MAPLEIEFHREMQERWKYSEHPKWGQDKIDALQKALDCYRASHPEQSETTYTHPSPLGSATPYTTQRNKRD